MGFFEDLVKDVVEGITEGAKEAVKEKLEYHDSYRKLIREVESENPNPEEILKSADIFLPLAVKLEERTEDEEVIKENTRKAVTVLFFMGCALLKLNCSKEAFKTWGEIIINFRDNADSEVQSYLATSYEFLDEYHGCPRCGSCHVKKVKHTGSSMAKNAAGQAGSYAGAAIGTAIGTVILPGIGSAVGGFLGQMVGSASGESLAEAAMSGIVRKCPDCGYKF